jgi:hypothetical protein
MTVGNKETKCAVECIWCRETIELTITDPLWDTVSLQDVSKALITKEHVFLLDSKGFISKSPYHKDYVESKHMCGSEKY